MAARAATPDSQPLLQGFDHARASLFKSPANVSLRSLEDADVSVSGSEDEEVNSQTTFWRRLRMAIRRRNNSRKIQASGTVRLLLHDERKRPREFRFRNRRLAAKACVLIPLLIFILYGFIHILNIFLGHVPIFLDNSSPPNFDWNIPEKDLLDITRDVTPIHCHSHNDYWRRVPLYDALRWGCTGVEADVWLFDEELHVGHSTNALTPNRTFRSMYVDPLVKLLDHQNQNPTTPSTSSTPKNGLFPKRPSETVVLLVDFKNNGHNIFPVVSAHLSALREKHYLTYYNGTATIPGPITIVATGNAPFDLIIANTTYRDIFFDAPLDRLYIDPDSPPSPPPSFSTPQHNNHHHINPPTPPPLSSAGQGTVGTTPHSSFTPANSFYASTNFGRSIGWLWFGYLSPAQLRTIRGQIRGARERGLRPRYWSAPKWPVGLRNRVWRLLVREGVGYLNGDDLGGMVRVGWDGTE
ncbi:hypothetical protein LEMA_P109650.1 [Plenodomus lingam JN3]|uniref:Altered inheritance of mitochondria protein 6 n=1 Tax=Leptosphaeria maculans (strain JN3 / isolate v23.1.3 / race Av1-4-5-6-7-8) TaxID=985895 RepID=E4ZZA5_LEPMJ|nr:hypothetical protein LEMA_P109650.1 [Plenodomus lingam JN3]CBX96700.1 hypothetical protein LEMA_P109650.1 [Plenodomus lingam JN3]